MHFLYYTEAPAMLRTNNEKVSIYSGVTPAKTALTWCGRLELKSLDVVFSIA